MFKIDLNTIDTFYAKYEPPIKFDKTSRVRKQFLVLIFIKSEITR